MGSNPIARSNSINDAHEFAPDHLVGLGHYLDNGRMPNSTSFHSGLVAIIGRANVGKSTILNNLVGQKVSIVSPKPHTTRHKLLGVLNGPGFQMGFLDTPGFLAKGRDHLETSMSRQAASALVEADLIILVVEPRILGDVEIRLIDQVRQIKTPLILAINKVDTVAKLNLLPIIQSYSETFPFSGIIPLSALYKDGLDLLIQVLKENLPRQEELFSPEILTDRPLRFLTSEIIREQVYLQYAKEIPYAVAVEIEDYEERESPSPDYIRATVYVNKESQRRLLIGKGGTALKNVGIKARQGIEQLAGKSVFVELWVKVNPDWRQKAGFIQRIL